MIARAEACWCVADEFTEEMVGSVSSADFMMVAGTSGQKHNETAAAD